jgi:hypothetical protein
VAFANEVLHVQPWERQAQIMRSVAVNRRTTVRSCHNSGKTFAAACLTQWFLHCFSPSLVITTATTDRQVEKQLWGEIHQQHLNSGLPGQLRMKGLTVSPSQEAIGFTTSEAEKFQGWHRSHILIIVDEASGVEEPIYAAIEGCLTGPDARLLLIGNPTNPAGSFFDSFRSELYAAGRFHIQAADVPEALLPATWAAERLAEWGEESEDYQVRVLGQFPPQGASSLINLNWVEKAQDRELPEGVPVVIGVDVAYEGDDSSVAVVRAGAKVLAIDSWRGFDTQLSAGRVARLANQYRPRAINVDVIGYGAGTKDRLKEEGFPVHGINVGEAAIDKERFFNRRTEIFWALRDRLAEGDLDLPAHAELHSQLTTLRYSYTPRGQLKLESKPDLKKRRPLGAKWRSPDHADALALAFATVGNRWVPVSAAGEAVAVKLPGFGEGR